MKSSKKNDKINMVLKLARTKKRWTQDELAKEASKFSERPITGNTIWNIEHYKTKPLLRNQRAIAQALGVSIDELFPLEEEEEPADFIKDIA